MLIVFRSNVDHPIRTTIAGVEYACEPRGTMEVPAKFAQLVIDRRLPVVMLDGQELPKSEPSAPARAFIRRIEGASTRTQLDKLGDEFHKVRDSYSDDDRARIKKAAEDRFKALRAAEVAADEDGDGNVPEGDTDEEEGEPIDAAAALAAAEGEYGDLAGMAQTMTEPLTAEPPKARKRGRG